MLKIRWCGIATALPLDKLLNETVADRDIQKEANLHILVSSSVPHTAVYQWLTPMSFPFFHLKGSIGVGQATMAYLFNGRATALGYRW